jgi:hypothetical protein
MPHFPRVVDEFTERVAVTPPALGTTMTTQIDTEDSNSTIRQARHHVRITP